MDFHYFCERIIILKSFKELQLNLKKELSTAITIVEKACDLCSVVQANLVCDETAEKKDRSPVTVADLGAQAIVINGLKKAFPDVSITAEEDASEISDPLKSRTLKHLEPYLPGVTGEEITNIISQGRYKGGKERSFWTLDPVDGTKGFLRKEQYAVALALIENGEVSLGVLGCPNLSINSFESEEAVGTIFYAVKDRGAYMKLVGSDNQERINVSQVAIASDTRVCESVETGHSSHNDSARVAELLKLNRAPIRMDSQCKYGVLARGEASIYLRLPTRKGYREKIWDHAAGYMIVKESGGEVTDCYGKKLDFSLGRTLDSNTGIIGSNGKIHNELVEAVGKVIA